MDGNFINILQQKFATLSEAQNELKNAKAQQVAAAANEFEMQRQYNYHNGGGDTKNANIVWPLLLDARAETIRLNNLVASMQANVNAAQLDYNNFKATLTPTEQQAVITNATAQSNSLLNATKAAIGITQQTTTKYLIIGSIVLVFIIGTVIIIRSRSKIA